MAIVLALLIVGWLVAFALGAQAGFDNQPASAATATQANISETAASGYREPISAS